MHKLETDGTFHPFLIQTCTVIDVQGSSCPATPLERAHGDTSVKHCDFGYMNSKTNFEIQKLPCDPQGRATCQWLSFSKRNQFQIQKSHTTNVRKHRVLAGARGSRAACKSQTLIFLQRKMTLRLGKKLTFFMNF